MCALVSPAAASCLTGPPPRHAGDLDYTAPAAAAAAAAAGHRLRTASRSLMTAAELQVK